MRLLSQPLDSLFPQMQLKDFLNYHNLFHLISFQLIYLFSLLFYPFIKLSLPTPFLPQQPLDRFIRFLHSLQLSQAQLINGFLSYNERLSSAPPLLLSPVLTTYY